MFAYPYIGSLLFGGDPVQVGLFNGTAIPNTAQVAGAALIYDQSFAADVAIVTKLVRNIMMALIVPGMIVFYHRRLAKSEGVSEGAGVKLLKFAPVFVLGFLLLAALRSVGDATLGSNGLAMGIWGEGTWNWLTDTTRSLSIYILAAVMAGVGLSTYFKALKGLGVKPFVVGLASAIMVGLTSIALVLLLGPLVRLGT